MCDYSLQAVKNRAATVGEKLVTTQFPNASTKGFSGVNDPETAVCVLPGTEIAFDETIKTGTGYWMTIGDVKNTGQFVGIFRQLHKDCATQHHDALELPGGETVMLHNLVTGQKATVLQLPATPKTEQEVLDQTRLEVVG